jgi:hypothetical protein
MSLGKNAVTLLAGLVLCGTVQAARYRVLPTLISGLPGETLAMTAVADTESGDNLVGVGHYQFAVDLTLGGTAGADGTAIGNVSINNDDFNDPAGMHIGVPVGTAFAGTAGRTADPAPTFGYVVGDEIPLFYFDLTIPETAVVGDMITVTPSEGALRSYAATSPIALVSPQLFETASARVLPEPGGLLILALGGLVAARRAWRS